MAFNQNRNRDRFSGRRTEKPSLYDAVCDKCGKDCKVPFRPSGDKPIYCSECFEQQGGNDRNDRRDRGPRRDFRESRDREMFTAVCDDCGKDCKVPFSPSKDKPIYCSACFEKRGSGGSGSSSSKGGCDNSKQLEMIIEKLDLILAAIEPKKKVVKKEVVKKEVTKKKAVAKKKVAKKE